MNHLNPRTKIWVLTLVLFGIHFLHLLFMQYLYPYQIYDPDLLSYFVYYQSLIHNQPALVGYMIPKPLAIFLLGPLDSPQAAFYCTLVIASLLGCLSFLLGARFLGPLCGVLLSLFLLLDPHRNILALRSGADFYLAFFLFLSIHLTAVKRPGLASLSLLLAALEKPVVIPCGWFFLLEQELGWKRRLLYGFLPLLALPITLFLNEKILGTPTMSTDMLGDFVTTQQFAPISPSTFFHYIFWTWLTEASYLHVAPWGFVGILLWLKENRQRLLSPFFLLPLLFLFGYFSLSFFQSYVPLVRFFWPIGIWFTGFIIYGLIESARQLFPWQKPLRLAMALLLLFFLLSDSLDLYVRSRDRSFIPFEQAMEFTDKTFDTILKKEWQEGDTLLTALVFLPYYIWHLKVDPQGGLIYSSEDAFVGGRPIPQQPSWVAYTPRIYTDKKAEEGTRRLLNHGYILRLENNDGALYQRR